MEETRLENAQRATKQLMAVMEALGNETSPEETLLTLAHAHFQVELAMR